MYDLKPVLISNLNRTRPEEDTPRSLRSDKMRFWENPLQGFEAKAPLKSPYPVAGLIILLLALGIAICVSLGAVILPNWPLFDRITLASLEWFPRFKLEMKRLVAMGAAEEVITLRRSLWQIYVAGLIANMIALLALLPFAKIDAIAALSYLEQIGKRLYGDPRVMLFLMFVICAAAFGWWSFLSEATEIGSPHISGRGNNNLGPYFLVGYGVQYFFCISLTLLFGLWKDGLLKQPPKA